ncbi:aldehyde ferredoxin oxidoreductase C-terminal domain-containing protein [Natrinema sp. 1APR25-10V2]|uniref:aldehyde ferredoxin oxidoreductase family protein n=1 Tax=Natrinema sp. 1APR25-10V2 TaxID=2951081 RepID=UPI0028759AE3|nr:aldehyde ferredoxin oxidoreductase C-terminal domain-containing protein [Natrinema sp. 1APR25-10V2]MDS0477319.1 aldehyde ferredoxin oxidoreductase [Natrinema sp. 1APR25-10V2]
MIQTRDHVVRIDLTTRTIRRERVPERWRRRFLGGKGLGARYLYAELEADVDPLGPNNVLGVLLGPCSGYLPGETRYAAVTKSPLTGGFLDSYAGGRFPARLAGALPNCLGLLVTGRADSPVALQIGGDGVELSSANELSGVDTEAVADAFPDAATACIGPAGESMVRYASIASDGGDHHAGRGGAGAVMGAKNLKVIVVRGDPVQPTGELMRLHREYADDYQNHETGRWLHAGATIESLDFADETGLLATRGWQKTTFDESEAIGVEAVKSSAVDREYPDADYPGGFRIETDEGDTVPRGATAMTLGAGLGIDDFDDVATLGAVCDRLGIDVIDAGNAVAWAIRAADAGYVDLEVSFGDASGAAALIERIATRAGPVADALADGVSIAADRYGGEAFIPTVKSMAVPSYDPRRAGSMALAYATSDRGGCHRRARPFEREVFDGEWTLETQVQAVITAQNVRSVLWSLPTDDFLGDVFDDLGAEWLAALGREYDASDLYRLGERVWTLVRLFNAREGFDRDDDSLPAVFRDPLPSAQNEASAIDQDDFERAIDRYYAARGWGPNGRPLPATLERLGLTDVVDSETPLDTPPADWTQEASLGRGDTE